MLHDALHALESVHAYLFGGVQGQPAHLAHRMHPQHAKLMQGAHPYFRRFQKELAHAHAHLLKCGEDRLLGPFQRESLYVLLMLYTGLEAFGLL